MNKQSILYKYPYIENYFLFLDTKKHNCSIDFDFQLCICKDCDIFQYCYGLFKKESMIKKKV